MSEELDRLNRELRMVNSCTRALVRAAREDELLREVCRLIVEVGGYRAVWVGLALHDARRSIRPVASVGIELETLAAFNLHWGEGPGGRGPAGRAIRSRAVAIAPDVRLEPFGAAFAAEAEMQGFASIIALPLIVDGECIGMLDIFSGKIDDFDESECALLRELADDVAYGIGALRTGAEHRQAQAQIVRLTRVLRMQSAIGLAVLRIGDRDELLQEACRIAIELGGYEVATVSIVDPDSRYARPVYRAGRPRRSASPPIFTISDGTTPDTSLTGLALRTGKLVVCEDLTRTELPVAAREALYNDGVRSIVALPLIVDGAKVGVLTMTSPVAGRIAEEELRLLEDVMATLSFALRSQQQADAVRYLAYFDSVTGLAKRGLFCDRLDSLSRNRLPSETAPAVVVLCVDRLGSINDRFGGNFGDRLLKDVAERLRRYAESDDVIGYLGGGMFVIAEPGPAAADHGALDSALLAEPFSIDGRVIRITASTGVARYEHEGDNADALVRRAETVLSRGRDAGAQFGPEIIVAHSEASDRIVLEHKLRRAIDARQFELHYLPQIELATRKVVCVEALLRWRDPAQGLLLPQQFLPVLESSGLINPVGQWVLQTAIDDGIRWQALGIGPVRISVNISASQIRRRAFTELCHKLLERWAVRMPGYGIDLELTESAYLQDIEGTTRKLEELRSAGVRVALDDFGTGYSSLGMLSRLPLDLIKIDGSLVRGLEHDAQRRALVGSIIAMASAFGRLTVAECVETPAQLKELEKLQCHQWQGALYSAPVSAAQLEKLLDGGGECGNGGPSS